MDPALNYDWMFEDDNGQAKVMNDKIGVASSSSSSFSSSDTNYFDAMIDRDMMYDWMFQRRYLQEEQEWTEEEISDWYKQMKIHGTLMVLGWGFFLPAAILCSLLLRHYNRHPLYPFWRLHLALAGVGFVLSLAGWIVALVQFDTLKEGPRRDEYGDSLAWTGKNAPYAHAVLGMVVMVGACVNTVFYGIMFQPRRADETFLEYPWYQKIGHISHRVLGYALLVLGLVACGTGTRITHSDKYNKKFLKCFVLSLIISTVFGVYLWCDKFAFKIRAQRSVANIAATNAKDDKHQQPKQKSSLAVLKEEP